MIGRNIPTYPWIKSLVGLSFSANELHSSCHQCLRTDASLTVPVKLAYVSYENVKENDSKPPIVIMHGLFGSKNNWNTLSKVIHKRTERKVIAIDARNHGDSPHSSNMSYKDMAEDVVQLMYDLGYERAVLVGHSMGGSAMMYTALSFPLCVDKLIIVDMSPIRSSPKLWQMTMLFEAMRSVKVDGSPTLSKARKAMDEQLAKSIKSVALRQFLATNLVEADSGKYKWRVNLPVLEQVFSTQLAVFPDVSKKTYKGPTLFIGGADSDYIKIQDHNAIKALFHQAEFRYINEADHWVHIDKPEEFINVLVNFINRSQPL